MYDLKKYHIFPENVSERKVIEVKPVIIFAAYFYHNISRYMMYVYFIIYTTYVFTNYM